jgi:hypothetical protein
VATADADVTEIMERITAWVKKTVPRTLTFITLSKVSGLIAAKSPRTGKAMPALLIKQSIRPLRDPDLACERMRRLLG